MKINLLQCFAWGIFLCFASCGDAPKKPIFEYCVIDLDIPFASSKPDEKTGLKGFYMEVGDLLANEMGMTPKSACIMAAFNNRPVREGLLEGRCTAQIGLPRTEGKWLIPNKVQLTDSFATMGYALAFPKDKPISKPEDLKGKVVGVQPGSPPHAGLNMIGGIEYAFFTFPEPAMKALAEGKIQVAFVWGPTAGYQNKYIYNNQFTIVPTTYTWDVSIGFGAKSDSLGKKMSRALLKLRPEIQQLYKKYGFPMGAPMIMPVLPFTQETQAEE